MNGICPLCGAHEKRDYSFFLKHGLLDTPLFRQSSYLNNKERFVWKCSNPECNKTAQQAQANIQREEENSRRIDRANNPEKYLSSYGIPIKYLDHTLSDFQGSEQIKDYLNEYAVDPSGFIFLTGSCGSGKTHLAIATLREAILKGFPGEALFTEVYSFLLKIRTTFNNKANSSEQKILAQYSNIDFLIIDDLGVEKASKWSNQILYAIINSRSNNLKPTIVTSNLSLLDIEKQLTPRVASRLAEGKVIKCLQKDYRKLRPSSNSDFSYDQAP